MTFEQLSQLTEANTKRIAQHDQWTEKFEAATLTLNDNLSRLEGIVESLAAKVAANAEATANLERQWQAYLTTLRKS